MFDKKNFIYSVIVAVVGALAFAYFMISPATGGETTVTKCTMYEDVLHVVKEPNALKLDRVSNYEEYLKLLKAYTTKVEPANNPKVIMGDGNIIISTVVGEGFLPMANKFVSDGDKLIFVFNGKCLVGRISVKKNTYQKILEAAYGKTV